MKEGFASQTRLMAQIKTSSADMKGAIDKLNKVTSEEYTGQEELKSSKAFMSSTHSRYKAEHCINGKDDGPVE